MVTALGPLLHGLLHCHDAAQARRTLSRNVSAVESLFTFLGSHPSFGPGRLTNHRASADVARLFALLALQTAAEGAEAQASLMAHVAGHAPAYAALLAPHLSERHVTALLHLLAAHGYLEEALPSAREAASYLRLLTAVAARVAEHDGSGDASGSPPELLVSLVKSMAAAAATMERLACSEEAVERMAAAASWAGGKGGKGAATLPRRGLHGDARVQVRFPVLAAALETAPAVVAGHLKLEGVVAGDQGATQLLVALLQLELLGARLPCTLHSPLCTLGWAMHHSAATGHALHTALEAAIQDGGQAGAAPLLQLLSSSLATLRALVVADKHDLAVAGVPSGQRHQAQQDCVRQLLRLEGAGAGPGPAENGFECPLSSLQLLWSLALHNGSAGCPVHRKAATLLHWCLAPGLPHLAAMLAQPAVRSLVALGGVQQLAASPYRVTLIPAVLACSRGAPGALSACDRQFLLAACQETWEARAPQAAEAGCTEQRGGVQPSLDAMDGLPGPAPAPQPAALPAGLPEVPAGVVAQPAHLAIDIPA